ncbi:uncharacterized protein LOC102717552 isoform X2 [Oryza brachyantha]|uniref:uncharacterized protein LOC102717552 isoform X2 n=1 Tax=Oryza brachyantha TaxID=4533 RepID=UPI001ADAE14F|nr:uncharacterized protein LOC102717552 isoform X2 [Oryza brachyantha]
MDAPATPYRGRRSKRQRGGEPSEEPSPASLLPDYILAEILLRLPPDPSSLPRVSLVCKRWLRLVTGPLFHGRFHNPGGRRAPLLGFFHNSFTLPCFIPTGSAPDRVPAEAFSLRRHPGRWLFLGCRRGRALLASPFSAWRHLMVWDPLSGDRHDIPVPIAFDQRYFRGAALLCDAAVCHRPTPFRVIFAFVDQLRLPCACSYSSQSGTWGCVFYGKAVIPQGLKSAMESDPVRLGGGISGEKISAIDMRPPVPVGNVLYWLLLRNYILAFNMDAKNLATNVIAGPDPVYFLNDWSVQIMPAEGGKKLGFLALKCLCLNLWVRQKHSGSSTASWAISRTMKLDMFLPPELLSLRGGVLAQLALLGSTEDGDVVFLQTTIGVFTVQLDGMKFKLVLPDEKLAVVYPYSSFYLTAGCIT